MLYCIIAEDSHNSLARRQKNRPEHLKRLENLEKEGRLFVAGPFPAIDSETPGENGFTGSLIIAEFDSLDQARQWAEDDPFVHGGVYKSVMVKPFKKVIP